jgi:PAS domain S-box-containing protein
MWQFTPVAWLYGTAAATSYALALFAWRMRQRRGAAVAAFLMASTGTWALGYLLGFFNTSLPWKLVFLRLEYLGVAGTGYCFALFALIYSHYEKWVNRATMALLGIVPAISYILILTTGLHDLFYRYYGLTMEGGLVVSEKAYGPAFWVFTGYNYILFFLGAALLIQATVRSPVLYRGQIATLIPAALIPLISNFLYIARINPVAPYDPSSLSFTLTSFLVAVSIGSYRFLDIVPVAHDLVVRNIGSGVVVVDRQTQILEMNPAAEEMLGCSRDDVLGIPFRKAFPEYGELAQRFRDMTETETEIVAEDAVYELQITPLQNRAESSSGWVIMLHDVTKRKEVETALWRAHNQMAALRRMESELSRKLDVNYVALLGLDAAIRLSFANAAFIALAEGDHLRVIQAYGRYPEEFPKSCLSLDAGIIGRVLRQKRPELVTDVSADPDYMPMIPNTCAKIVTPLMSQDRFIGILNLETSKPGRFSPYLFEILTLLAGRVAVAIDNARAYEERERLIDDLDAYAHTVAHGLKNPLAATISYAEVIRQVGGEDLDERVQRCVTAISQSSRKMAGIIDGLLLLSSVRQSKEVESPPLNMAASVSEAQGRLSKMIAESGAEIVAPKRWPKARGYAPWVEEIWANYISNAIKYGGSPPRVKLGADRQPNGMVRFWVRDNGEGFPPEEQAQLFIPFSRLDPDRAEGHGLGLSIVQRIVEKLGGEAGVESEVGKGSLFFFTLPGVDA